MAKQKKVKEKKFENYVEDEETNKLLNEIFNEDEETESDGGEEKFNAEISETLSELGANKLKKNNSQKNSGVKGKVTAFQVLASKVYYQGRLIQLIDKFLYECYFKSSSIEDYSLLEIQREYEKALNKFSKLIEVLGEVKGYEILIASYINFYQVYFLDLEEYRNENGKFKFDYNDEARKNAIFSYECFQNCYGIMMNFACVDLESYYRLADCANWKNRDLFEFANYALAALKSYVVGKNKKQIATKIDDKHLTKIPDNVIECLQNLMGWEKVFIDRQWVTKLEDAFLNYSYNSGETNWIFTKIKELLSLKKSDVYDVSLTAIQREIDKRFANKNVDKLSLDMFAYRKAEDLASYFDSEARAAASNLATELRKEYKGLFLDFDDYYKLSLKYKPDDNIIFLKDELENELKNALEDVLKAKRKERAELKEKERLEREEREKKRFEALSKKQQKKELKRNAKWERKHQRQKEKEEKQKQRKELKKNKQKKEKNCKENKPIISKPVKKEKIKREKPQKEHKNIFAGFVFNEVAKFAIIVIVATILLCIANHFGLFIKVAEYIHAGSRFCFKHFHKMLTWTNWAAEILSKKRGFWSEVLLILPLLLLFVGTFLVELVWTIVWGIIIIVAGVLLIILSGAVSFLPVVMAVVFAVSIIVTCVKRHSSSWDALWVIISLALCVVSVVLFFQVL